MTQFETVPCSRCGGSGRYSYCQMHGDTCFGCGGKGIVHSKRAKKALEWLRKKREILIDQVQVGMRVYVNGVGKFTVREVALGGGSRYLDNATGEWKDYYTIRGQKLGYSGFPGKTTVQLIPPVKIAAQQIAEAIEYQNSLPNR